MLKGITWVHHASLLLQRAGKVVYIDPWELPEGSPIADVVLITHEHFDHYSPPDIEKISNADTQLTLPTSMLGKVQKKVRYVKFGDKLTLNDVHIEIVAAYNKEKSFHPQSSQWVGYIVELDGVRYYHTGDTDYIPEMKKIKADVLFLPVGGTYTMDANSAAQAAQTISPKIAVPIHWGKIIGSQEDAVQFAAAYKGTTQILRPGQKN